jgi:hypothetical protein
MSHICNITYADQFKSAMTCNSKEEAEAWMEKEIEHYVSFHDKTPVEALDIIKYNLGYMAGNHGGELQVKTKLLFQIILS